MPHFLEHYPGKWKTWELRAAAYREIMRLVFVFFLPAAQG